MAAGPVEEESGGRTLNIFLQLSIYSFHRYWSSGNWNSHPTWFDFLHLIYHSPKLYYPSRVEWYLPEVNSIASEEGKLVGLPRRNVAREV